MFIGRYSTNLHKNVTGVSEEAMKVLAAYSWPGNVRELENTVERAVNFARTDQITLQDLPEDILRPVVMEEYVPADEAPDRWSTQNTPRAEEPNPEYRRLVELLEEHHGSIKAISEEVGIPVSTLYGKLNRYGLRAKDYKTL